MNTCCAISQHTRKHRKLWSMSWTTAAILCRVSCSASDPRLPHGVQVFDRWSIQTPNTPTMGLSRWLECCCPIWTRFVFQINLNLYSVHTVCNCDLSDLLSFALFLPWSMVLSFPTTPHSAFDICLCPRPLLVPPNDQWPVTELYGFYINSFFVSPLSFLALSCDHRFPFDVWMIFTDFVVYLHCVSTPSLCYLMCRDYSCACLCECVFVPSHRMQVDFVKRSEFCRRVETPDLLRVRTPKMFLPSSHPWDVAGSSNVKFRYDCFLQSQNRSPFWKHLSFY